MLDMVGEAALRTALLAGVVQCSLWLLRIRQPQLLLATWTIVLAASLTMPLLLRVTPLRLPLDPALSSTLPSALPSALIIGAAGLMQQPSLTVPLGNAVAEARTQSSLQSWPEAAYLIVYGAIILRVVVGVGLSLRILARSVPVRAMWAAGMRVRISSEVAGPVTIARAIVLPVDVAGWSIETRQAVLAHERAHVARHDFAMLVASQLNRALFWFSPLSWWLHRRLVALSELASDDAAIAATRDRLGYAEILLEMGRRSGPLPRGPAMARLSTLPQRIDRILLDQPVPSFVIRSQQMVLMAGAAGLSLAVASLTPGAVPAATLTRLAQQHDPQTERAIAPAMQASGMGDAVGQGTTAQHIPLQGDPAETTPSPVAEEGRARSNPSFASPHPAPFPATAGQPPRTAALAPQRAALRTATKNASVLPPPRAMAKPSQAAPGEGPQPLSTRTTQLPMADGFEAASRTGSLAGIDAHSPLRPQFSDGSLSLSSPPAFEAVVGHTCAGTLVVGQRAWQGAPNRQPDVVAGQTLPVQAQFFRRNNGTSWVRFNVFGRPSLDLPVRFARSGMTWTGEYGISYTVRYSGGHSLTGLAALIANDSAAVEFDCEKSAITLF